MPDALAEVQEAGRGLDASTTTIPLSAQRTRHTLLAELHEALGDAEAAQQARAELQRLEGGG